MPIDREIADRLEGELGLGPASPAYHILSGPQALTVHQTPEVQLAALMQNYLSYGRGRGGWSWVSALGNANGVNSFNEPRARGLNLLNGAVTETNCDGFRQGFWNLATHVLEIQGIGYADIGPIANGGYLTKPGGTTIDAHWLGNVRTDNQTFEQLGVYKFSEHHFLRYHGRYYDPTVNATYAVVDDMKWAEYTLETSPVVIQQFSGLRVFRIVRRYLTQPACPQGYLVEIGSSGGWPTNLLTTANHLNYGNLGMMLAAPSRR